MTKEDGDDGRRGEDRGNRGVHEEVWKSPGRVRVELGLDPAIGIEDVQ